MATYNGHRSWNAWNVYLWLSNDYRAAQHIDYLIAQHGKRKATGILYRALEGTRTPDGARYNLTCIRETIQSWG